MQLKLRVTAGSHAGREIKVPGSKFLIGRSEDCQLRANSDKISRHHCVITNEGTRIVVRDLGSKNGTELNDRKLVGEEAELNNSDRLVVGPLQFEVLIVADTQGEKKPKVSSVAEAAARTAEGSSADEGEVEAWLSEFGPPAAANEDTAVLDSREQSTISHGGENRGKISKFMIPKDENAAAAQEEEERKQAAEKNLPPSSRRNDPNDDSREAAAEAIRRIMKR